MMEKYELRGLVDPNKTHKAYKMEFESEKTKLNVEQP